MTACPKCNADIPWYRLSTGFNCPDCDTNLQSNYAKVMRVGIPVGMLAEIALFMAIRYMARGDLAATFALWLIVGGLAGFIVYWVTVALYIRVSSTQ
jgi:hypothetical protein